MPTEIETRHLTSDQPEIGPETTLDTYVYVGARATSPVKRVYYTRTRGAGDQPSQAGETGLGSRALACGTWSCGHAAALAVQSAAQTQLLEAALIPAMQEP